MAATDSIAALAATIGRAWLWLPAIAGIAALVERALRAPTSSPSPSLSTDIVTGTDRPIETRWAWAMLALSFVIAGPVLATRFDVPPSGVGLYVVNRFHILPALLLAIPVADALGRLGDLARPRLPALAASRPLAIALAVAVFGATVGTALPHILAVHSRAVEAQVRSMLRSLPADAVVFGFDDDFASVTPYAQLVLHERPDVTYVHAPLMSLPWYRARMRARGFSGPEQMVGEAIASGRPVFVQPALKQPQTIYAHYPFGIVERLLPPGGPPPSLDEVIALNKTLYEHFDLAYPRPGLDDEWPTAVHQRYAHTWQVLAQKLAVAGRLDEAYEVKAIGVAVGPAP